MINIRQLFQKYKIPWIDHGPNVGKHNINVACPFCGSSDRSYHMAIQEELGYWYCFRNPRHKGQNVAVLLRKLNIPSNEYKGLELKEEGAADYEDHRNYVAWNYFEPAEESQEALDYLESRLFSDPVSICRTFNLRISRQGQWAKRILIPLTIGWTGRSVRKYIEPKYLSYTNADGFFFYSNRSSSVVLMEGPIDCIKFGASTTQFDIIGKCGKRLSPALLVKLREQGYYSIHHIPDSDVPFSQYHGDKKIISSYCTFADISNVTLPVEKKDVGEMQESEVRLWIRDKMSQSL